MPPRVRVVAVSGVGFFVEEVPVSFRLSVLGALGAISAALVGPQPAVAASPTSLSLSLSLRWVLPSSDWAAQGPPSAVAAGDTNGDGLADLAVTTSASAEVHLGGVAGPDPAAIWSEPASVDSGGAFGHAAALCDLDGDGFADLVVGDSVWDRVEVHPGASSGPTAGYTLSMAASASFGVALSCGDVDGDGVDDLLVGAPFAGDTGAGALVVYRSEGPGLPVVPWWRADGPPGAGWGGTVAVLGDVNGDGWTDLAAGPGATDRHYVHVFHGSATGPSTRPDWTVDPGVPAPGARRGWAARAGDVDGDGYNDLLVGDRYAPPMGRVDLHRGSAAGLEGVPVWTLDSAVSEQLWGIGERMTGLPDLDGDGYPEIGVYAGSASQGYTGDSPGAVHVFRGSAAGPSATPDATVLGSDLAVGKLLDVAGGGDVDGDGTDELLVAAAWGLVLFDLVEEAEPLDDTGTTDSGTVPTTADTGSPSTTEPPPVSSPSAAEGGCGCASPGGTPGPVWFVLLGAWFWRQAEGGSASRKSNGRASTNRSATSPA